MTNIIYRICYGLTFVVNLYQLLTHKMALPDRLKAGKPIDSKQSFVRSNR